jgi:hypothetical protein
MQYGKNKPDDQIQEIIDNCEKELLNSITPAYYYSIFNINHEPNKVTLENCDLSLIGEDISNHLKDCDKAILFCATLSHGPDKLIRINQVRDMTKSIIIDALASAAIEQICDLIQEEIKERFPSLYQTWRFSPGYGDLPLDIQKEFINVLSATKRAGISSTNTNMLIPSKSVTAIIGLSENIIPKQKRGCQVCSLRETCVYRLKGEHCGF